MNKKINMLGNKEAKASLANELKNRIGFAFGTSKSYVIVYKTIGAFKFGIQRGQWSVLYRHEIGAEVFVITDLCDEYGIYIGAGVSEKETVVSRRCYETASYVTVDDFGITRRTDAKDVFATIEEAEEMAHFYNSKFNEHSQGGYDSNEDDEDVLEEAKDCTACATGSGEQCYECLGLRPGVDPQIKKCDPCSISYNNPCCWFCDFAKEASPWMK